MNWQKTRITRLTTELLPFPSPILPLESMNNWKMFLPISSCSSLSLLSSCALVFSLFSLLCKTLAISTIAPLYITNPSCPFLTGVLRLLGELFTISSLFGSNKRLPVTKHTWHKMFIIPNHHPVEACTTTNPSKLQSQMQFILME